MNEQASEQKTCFVVMGFGKKTDHCTGRVLDLDKSYRNIIRPAALAAGLKCIRADEIRHSGLIELPMYEQLLTADVVIADVSTSNCNAFYELGVRHALRPYTTITIAEEKMIFPFDVNHISIRRYQHLGDGIDSEEVDRMRGELQVAITQIAARPQADSPVYSFLSGLTPPSRAATQAAMSVAAQALGSAGTNSSCSVSNTAATVSELMKTADDAIANGNFLRAKSFLSTISEIVPRDPTVTQKLALVTYKSKVPTPVDALNAAKELLQDLYPDISTDTETLGLWGSIHKRLWDLTHDRAALDEAIFAYEKGFQLRKDYYNGINYAFALNIRAKQSSGDDAIADSVLARRARERVIALCEDLLQPGKRLPDEYWLYASMAEAWFGLNDRDRMLECIAQAEATTPAPADWMRETTRTQISQLAQLLGTAPPFQLARASGT